MFEVQVGIIKVLSTKYSIKDSGQNSSIPKEKKNRLFYPPLWKSKRLVILIRGKTGFTVFSTTSKKSKNNHPLADDNKILPAKQPLDNFKTVIME